MKKLITKWVLGSPIKGEKSNLELGTLQLSKTIVPTSFLSANPTWDRHLYGSLTIVDNSKKLF